LVVNQLSVLGIPLRTFMHAPICWKDSVFYEKAIVVAVSIEDGLHVSESYAILKKERI